MKKDIFQPDPLFRRLFLPQKPRQGVTYVPSQFALPFSHKGKPYTFNMLTRQCLQTELPSSARTGEGFDDLIEAMFLVPEGKDECAFYQSVSGMMRLYTQKSGVGCYTILPTLCCNARCTYCYEEGYPQVTMTPETADRAVRYILDTRADGELKLRWFGGEPLLCPDLIDRICQGLRQAGVPYRSSVISNGSLVTPQILEKMRGLWNVKHVQISMDGAEEDYAARKRYCGGRDQYHTVMDAVSRLSGAGITVAVRCNADEENWEGVPRFLNDLKERVLHKDNVRVYISPLGHVRDGDNDVVFWEKILNARALIEEAGFRASANGGMRLSFRTNHCMADRGDVVIGPDGGLFACEHCPPGSRFGDVFRGVTDEAARREFCRTDRTREKCRGCTFLPECTSFSACPWRDTHCREMRELMALNTIRREMDRTEEDTYTDEDDFIY
jgi:radical SAM protein with 4Fe4S-binding SPASM domain